MKEDVQDIAIERIRVLNPRYRDKKKFEGIVRSIRVLGLKKPIKVSLREGHEGEYDLVCGQGRIEAFVALGQMEIPAIVVEASKEDRLLMSLVENMARRFPSPIALIGEIGRLKEQGYSNAAIAEKLDLSGVFVGGLIALKGAGEERLLEETVRGRVPLSVAIEISKAETVEMQTELLNAYERKDLTFASIRTVKRLIEQRRFLGKARGGKEKIGKAGKVTADGMVHAFRKESQRQQVMIRKARICEAKLLFLVTAFKRLFEDEDFVTLLRAEGLQSMPKPLAEKITSELKKAA